MMAAVPGTAADSSGEVVSMSHIRHNLSALSLGTSHRSPPVKGGRSHARPFTSALDQGIQWEGTG